MQVNQLFSFKCFFPLFQISCFHSEQFIILKVFFDINVESKIYDFNYFYFSVLGLYIFFFFLWNFPVIASHWKAEHCYRLTNWLNLQGSFLTTLFIGWIDRFGEWTGDYFCNSQGAILKKLVSYVFFYWSVAQYFPPGFFFIICVLALIVSSSERLLPIALSN